MLRGSFPAKIDEKGRVKIPADFRKILEDRYGSETDLYVTSPTGESVLIYPMSEWEQIEAKMLEPPKFTPEKQKFLRNTNFFGQVAQMDKQGRVLIQPRLRESAGISGEINVMGNLNHLEVWDDQRFASLRAAEPYTSKDAQALALLGL